MTEEEDLFGAFGDESDSDSDAGPDHEKAQALIQLANKAAGGKAKESEHGGTTIHAVSKIESEPAPSETVDLSNLKPCKLESCVDPLYLSPDVALVSSLPFGGGRGYVAWSDLKPGTLVMIEKSIMTWPDEQLGCSLNLSSIHRLIHHPDARKVVHCLEEFHPTKEVVDSTVESESPDKKKKMLEFLTQKHRDDEQLPRLVEESRKLRITNRDGSPLSSTDLLRILLALRYNGLESGLYCHVAMINHQCQPNCVKFLPNGKESDLPENCSEVRTTRWIKAGECLTISYMPKLVSHASRRAHLWEQHRFDIGTQLDPSLQRMELINGGLPKSSKEFVDEDGTSSRVERSLAELDVLYQSTQQALSSNSSPEAVEQAKALEVSSLELFLEAKRQLQNDQHLLLIPCLVLHLDACDLVLREDMRNTILSNTQRCKLLGRTVATALRLVELQIIYLGKDHYDVARTNLDLAQSLQELLSKFPDHLKNIDAHRPDLKAFRDWSALEYKCQKEYERIAQLYPRDASSYLARQE